MGTDFVSTSLGLSERETATTATSVISRKSIGNVTASANQSTKKTFLDPEHDPGDSDANAKKIETKTQQLGSQILKNRKILSALFYALASSLITIINKVVLTSYGFPSYQFLALGQVCATIVILNVAKRFKLVTFPPLERDSFKKIFPLPFLFLGNVVTGLGATKEVSLPMLASLRRFSILMTMVAEYYTLGVKASVPVQFAVYTMVGGSLLASANDLSFNLEGYALITLSNAFTTGNGVYIKQKLNAKNYGEYGLIYYNAVFCVVPLFALTYFTGDIHKAIDYDGWLKPCFLFNFLLSCIMGFVLNASIVLCTQYNSALATCVIGCLKNISVTYLGMFIGGDYVYTLSNFIGINISVLGSLLYTYVTFKP